MPRHRGTWERRRPTTAAPSEVFRASPGKPETLAAFPCMVECIEIPAILLGLRGRRRVQAQPARLLSRLTAIAPLSWEPSTLQNHVSPERGGGREAGGGFETRRIRELEFMVPEFVARTGGSNRVQAQPAGGRESVFLRGGCADRSFSGESRKTEEIDRSNLWRSISCAIAR